LFLFSSCAFINAAGWICFGPISNLVETAYGVSLGTVNYLSMSYMLWFLPMNFLSVTALDKYGLRIGVCIGIVLTAIGFWVKCLI